MPKNTGSGLYIAAFSFIAGFAIIWHIIWLIPIGILGALASVIIRALDQDTEYTLSAKEVTRIEAAHKTI